MWLNVHCSVCVCVSDDMWRRWSEAINQVAASVGGFLIYAGEPGRQREARDGRIKRAGLGWQRAGDKTRASGVSQRGPAAVMRQQR